MKKIMTSNTLLLFPSLLLLRLLTSVPVVAFSTTRHTASSTATAKIRRWQHVPATSAASVRFGLPSNNNRILLLSLAKASHPEYSIVEGNDDKDEEATATVKSHSVVESPVSVAAAVDSSTSATSTNSENNSKRMQNQQHPYYTALSPGTVVQAKVGDVRLARKAWKKRRRSGSPLLVPCSVLAVDATSALLWNVLYLLQKFGHDHSPNKNKSKKKNEITLTLNELLQRHATHLKLNLKHYIAANPNTLDFDNVKDLIKNILNERVQESYGIKLVIPKDNNDNDNDEYDGWYLTAPISRLRAQQRASQAAILQFSSSDMTMATSGTDKNENDESDSANTFQHTGMVRIKRTDKTMTTTTTTSADDKTDNKNHNNNNMYVLQPLSAALRVSQDDIDSGLVQNDSLHPAVVLEYDLTGDNGSPLLILSLNPRRQLRDGLKISSGSSSVTRSSNTNTRLASNKNNIRIMPIKHKVQDLQVGNGPLQAKVVRLVKGGALVDCGVGRQQSSWASSFNNNNNGDDDLVPVLGFLRFKDAVRFPATATKTKSMVDDDDDDDDNDEDDLEDDIPDDSPWEEILSFDDLDDDEDQNDDDNDDVDVDVDTFNKPPTTSTTKSPSSTRKPRVEDMDLSALLLEDDEKEGGVIDTEDVTHLFQQNEDGSYTYTDPETGYSQVILNNDFDSEDDDENEEDDEDATTVNSSFATEQKNDLFISKPTATLATTTQRRRNVAGSSASTTNVGLQRKILKIGESINVYVLSASKQSNQVKVTMNPDDVFGKSARDLKKQEAVNKKLGRLAKQLGFRHDGSVVDTTTETNVDNDDDLSSFSLHRAMKYWKGREMNGIVKATSQTGDWLYVQPQQDEHTITNTGARLGSGGGGGFLPVGVASIYVEKNGDSSATAKAAASMQEFRQGDPVRIRIQGIDKERGQLALRVLHKLAP